MLTEIETGWSVTAVDRIQVDLQLSLIETYEAWQIRSDALQLICMPGGTVAQLRSET